MRTPAELYVKYLIVCNYTNTRIDQLMESLGYPRMSSSYLSGVRNRINIPTRAFRPGVHHRVTDRWLRKQNLYPLFYRDNDVDEATMALSNGKVRPLLEALILSGTGVDEIVRLVGDRTGKRYSEKSVEYYQLFFWNRDYLSSQEWDIFLGMYDGGSELKGLYDEGTALATWRLGFPVAGVDANDMLKSMQNEAFYRFMQTHTMRNDLNTAKMAKEWAVIMFEASKLLNSGDTQLAEVISQFEAIFMKKSKDKLQSVDSLPGMCSGKMKELSPKHVIIDVDNRYARVEAEIENEYED